MNFRIAESLVQPFVQQLWQVSVLVLIVAAIAPFVGRWRPHLAYVLWLLVAVKCVTPPLIGSPTGVFSLIRSSSTTASSHVSPEQNPIDVSVSPPADFGATAAPSFEPTSDPTQVATPIAAAKATSKTTLSLSAILLIVWAVGAILYGAYLTLHWFRFRRIIARGSKPDDKVAQIYRELLQQYNVANAPKLVQVTQPFGPAVVGCLTPTIVLPSRLLGDATTSELRSILYHELTHVRRSDVWMSWLQVAAGAVWWFHPLVWYANRQIVRWREASCDEEVIARMAIQPRQYAEALLRVLESRVQPFPAMQIGMAIGESTERRLVRLMNRTRHCRATPVWCWIVVLLASVAFLPGAAWSWQGTDDASKDSPVGENRAQFVFQPVDAEPQVTGQLVLVGTSADGEPPADPMVEQTLTIRGTAQGPNTAGAKISMARMTGGKPTAGKLETEVDANGKFVFEKDFKVDRSAHGPQDRVILHGRTADGLAVWKEWQVSVTPSGLELVEVADDSFTYVVPSATVVANNQAEVEDKKTVDIELTFPEESGTVSGVLRDHLGKPVAGAAVSTVALVNSPGPKTETEWESNATLVSFPVQDRVVSLHRELRVSTRTAADGSWNLGKFAAGKRLDVAAFSPNSASTVARVKSTDGGDTIAIQLPKSTKCKLTVLDDLTGKPVPDAGVTCSQQLNEKPLRIANAMGKTDEQGRVELDLPIGECSLQLEPDTKNPFHSFPTSKSISVASTTRDLQVRMDTGALLEFHVRDDATGKPIPFLPVRVTEPNSLTTRESDIGELQRGVTRLACLPGKARFTVPAAYQGYEIVNPIEKPIDIAPGRTTKYTFRLRRMEEYRPPIARDNLADFSAKHQNAVAKLREKGALVATIGNTRDANCEVFLSQFWEGKPEDLRWLAELEFFKVLHCLKYPVPKAFRETQKPAPLVTDDWLHHIGKATDLDYLYITRSSISDAGLASLAGCQKMHVLMINDSKIEGRGIKALASVPLHHLHIGCSSGFKLGEVDLTAMDELAMVHFESADGPPIIPPRGGGKLLHVHVSPANAKTFERLNEYAALKYLFVEGQGVTDHVLKSSAVIQRIESLSLDNTSVTDAGLAALATSKLSMLRLVGNQFTDAAVQNLNSMPELKNISLRDTSISDEGIKRLNNSTPKKRLVVLEPSSAN